MMPEIEHIRGPPGLQLSDDNALFEKYEVGKLLGCGAFAKVYHARDVRNGQSVAIKVINKKKISSSTMVGNIKREISVMRLLHNPHIVKLFEVLATKTKIYFVMEFVKGGELFAKVAKGRFSEDLSRKYFRQLVSAVGYCHSRGIFHRDLKPENLLLDDNGDLKVSDFGLSAVADQVRQDGLLHTLCGTPAYVAPEILTKKGYDGAKADVWSCGVVLYVLAAGYFPFNDPNLMVMYKKIYKGEFRCPKWMSPDLKRLLSRLLDTNPATRITIDEITDDPWFRKGSKGKIKFYDEFLEVNKDEDQSLTGASCLNAFDIISFSSGLNLSGLFDGASGSVADSARLVVGTSPEEVMQRLEGFATAEKIRLRKRREWVIDMEGQDGKFTASVVVYRLTESLVVVEGRRTAGDAEMFREAWRDKIEPAISGRTENQVSGSC